MRIYCDDNALIAELEYLSKYGAANGRERRAYALAATRLKALKKEVSELWNKRREV